MKLQNKAMLITYPDSLGHNLKDLSQVMDRYFSKAIGGIHLLPFFPSHGDRGFSPMTYEKVAPEFGTWSDVEKLGEQYYLMFDFMINHISAHSDYYLDLQKNKEKSPWRDLFLSWDKFWPAGRPTQADVDLIYKRKDKAPWEELEFADGSREKMWNTFGPDQIDLDVRTEVTKCFVKETLQQLVKHQASLIRLDAFAYAVKKLDTSDFFVEPEIWDLLDEVRQDLAGTDAQILPEIHEHYSLPRKVSEHGYFIYDFALPMVLLYSLYTGKSQRLAAWLKQCPMKQFTTLDTHDGLGVVDAKDILTDEEIDYTTQELYKIGLTSSGNTLHLSTTIWTFTKSIRPITQPWAMMTKSTSWPGCCKFLPRGFRRSTMLACWPGKTTWTCWNGPRKAGTSTATTTAWKKLTRKLSGQLLPSF